MKRLQFALALALLCATAALSAAPQAERKAVNIWSPAYDVRLEVLPDGSLDVVESVTLSVGAKPMTWFDRVVPSRRTDGLTNVAALMDGQSLPVSISHDRDGDLRVRWDFSPTANATHTFEIRYRAVRVLGRDIDGPRLLWTALPRRHSYPIDASRIALYAPAGSIATYVGATGGVVQAATPRNPGVVITGTGLKKDRAVSVDVTFAPNSIRPVEPQWFVVEEEQKKMLPAWLAAAASLVAIGVGILVMMFARLPKAVAPDADGGFVSPADEGSVPAGLATFLLGRGQHHAGMAHPSSFFRLVRDGHLLIEKSGASSRWKGQRFDVSLSATGSATASHLAPHEIWILDAVRGAGGKADLYKTMSFMTRRPGAFRALLMNEASTRGWVDPERLRARSGLMTTGFVLMLSGVIGSVAVLLLVGRLGPAPVAIPGVTLLVGAVYVIVASAMSVLSEAGLREAARWQARVAELKDIIKSGASGRSPQDFERWFPLAIGAGLASKWLKAFESQLAAAGTDLRWLTSMGSPRDAAASLAMIVAVGGASRSGGGGGAGGGGAGGGSSGAG